MAKKRSKNEEQEPLFKISFVYHNTIYEIFARQIAESTMFGFIEVEELVFDTRSSVVVDPSEERLKNEFSDVKRTYIPMHSILRIDEVAERGTAKITDILSDKGKVSHFPSALYTSKGTPDIPSKS